MLSFMTRCMRWTKVSLLHGLAAPYSHLAGHVHGEKLSLQQIQELARADAKYQDMTQDEKDELLHALTEYCTLKNISVCTMNAVASHNVQSMLEHVFKIVSHISTLILFNWCPIAQWTFPSYWHICVPLCNLWSCLWLVSAFLVWNWQCDGLLGGCDGSWGWWDCS